MRFGIYVSNFGDYHDARVLAQLAQDAERAGWDGFFLWLTFSGRCLPLNQQLI
jgi:hypothetical protein